MIQAAVEHYQRDNQVSYRQLEVLYGVNKSTIHRRLRGTPNRQRGHQHEQNLSPESEKLLVDWCLDLERSNNAPNLVRLREMASIISRFAGGREQVGKRWLERFIKRNPEVRRKKARLIDAERAVNASTAVLTPWFARLRVIIDDYRISLNDTYNMDEVGVRLGLQFDHVVVGTSATARASKSTPPGREQATIIECVSAGGLKTRPLVIFKGKHVQTTWFNVDDAPDWKYCCSSSGWTNNAIGLRWLQEIFIPSTATADWRLLLVDGHGSHITTEFMWHCRQNQIFLFILPPHTSHVLQPLDLAVFGPIKARYRKELAAIASLDDNAPIKKQRFITVYAKARSHSLSSTNILKAFAAAGISPWNPSKVLQSSQVAELQLKVPNERQSTPPTSDRTHFETPKTIRQAQLNILHLERSESVSRNTKRLLLKTTKAISVSIHERAAMTQQLSILQQLLDEKKAKSKRKVAVDANDKFVGLPDLIAAETRSKELESRYLRNRTAKQAEQEATVAHNQCINSMIVEFHAYDTSSS